MSRPGFIGERMPDKDTPPESTANNGKTIPKPLGGWQGSRQPDDLGMEQRPESPNLFRPGPKAKVEDVQWPADPNPED